MQYSGRSQDPAASLQVVPATFSCRGRREKHQHPKEVNGTFFFSIRDTPEDINLCTFRHKPPRLAPGGLILVQSMVPRGPYLTAWSREGLGG